MKMNRRKFMQSATATGVALSAPNLVAMSSRGKKYRTALIGSGWWGKVITEMAMQDGSVKMIAVCDVDDAMNDSAVALIKEKSGETPKVYKDYRELLKREKPEICIIGTPDHWHPLIAIAAAEAGCHIYVEKPVGHTILEGRAMVNAARAANRVMQVGTHRRVTPHGVSAYNFVKEGKLGKIGMVRAFVPGGASSAPIKATPNEDPPAGLDWDMWCGPAPLNPYNPAYHPRRWRQYLDYANGQIADWVHWTDIIKWFMGDHKHPKSASAVGGIMIRNPLPADAPKGTTVPDAPDTLDVHWQFDDYVATWEHHQYGGNNHEKGSIGCYFFGDKGVLHVGWKDGWTFHPARNSQQTIHVDAVLHEPSSQNVPELWADFIDAIENKRKPVSDIEIGHWSTTMSLLGIVSWKLGRSVEWDGDKELCPGDAEANALLRREYRDPWVYPEV
ncbi:MAG: Gfo/Idh/MocA family protein [Puniceicoccaceae bacterium]